jgi:hypothetical protein
MTNELKSSDFIRLVLKGLGPVCRERKCRLVVAMHLRAALDALFDGPSGSLVTMIPGGEQPEDQEDDEVQVWDKGLSLVVSHRLLPTSTPNQALYESVAGAEPFLDLIDALRDAMRDLDMPQGSTGGYWRYLGMAPVEFQGIPMPAFKLDFSIYAAPTTSRGVSVEISGID